MKVFEVQGVLHGFLIFSDITIRSTSVAGMQGRLLHIALHLGSLSLEPVGVSASGAQDSDLSAELNSVSAHPLTTLSSNIATLLFLMFFLIQMLIEIFCVGTFQAFFMPD